MNNLSSFFCAKPQLFSKRLHKISFLSLTTLTNMLLNPKGNKPKVFIYSNETKQIVIKIIEMMKKTSDFVIIAMHYGDEYLDRPNQYQLDVSREIAEAGADLILGNHSHHIQRPEFIYTKNKKRKVFVSYSQGNFISHQNRIDSL
ncbi:MAG TPA: CapA family protein, partial [Exilispira sp.]|nr:CapA family protein [Exilispira sp.]